MTLGPGDVVLTGAPGEYGPIAPGDDVSVTIDGIGTLSNPVVGTNRTPRRGDRGSGMSARAWTASPSARSW